ncbi:hypothetical protein GCM10027596_38320 [Nocardioides korecus]
MGAGLDVTLPAPPPPAYADLSSTSSTTRRPSAPHRRRGSVAAVARNELEGTTPHTLRRTTSTQEIVLANARKRPGHAHPGAAGRDQVARGESGPDVRDGLSAFFAEDGKATAHSSAS